MTGLRRLPRRWKQLLLIAAAVMSAGAAMLAFANFRVMKCDARVYAAAEEVPVNEFALLLGTAPVTRGIPNAFFVNRIEAAVRLHQAGKVDKIIVSGDNSRREYDETTAMAEALEERGIPREKILMDYAGFRTLDSVVRAKNLFGARKITVISQRFHCRRAIFIAEANGMEAFGFEAEDVSRRSSRKTLVREPLACLLAWIDTRVLHRKPHFEE